MRQFIHDVEFVTKNTFYKALYAYYKYKGTDPASIFGYPVCGKYVHGFVRHILIIEYGRNPSTDYHVLPFLKDNYSVPIDLLDISDNGPKDWDAVLSEGTFVVIVRYATRELLEKLAAFRTRLRGVVYFLDDHFPSAMENPEVSLEYKKKLSRLFFVHRRDLAHLCSDVWVSSRYLQEKYSGNAPTLIHATPEVVCEPHDRLFRLFYHGTSNHWQEMKWLHSIIQKIQGTRNDTHFEIIGDHRVNRLYRGIPRTTIVHPMSWENYRAYCRSRRMDIGLAPLLDNPFNAARSHSKYFDILRCGAVGIYSDRPPYDQFVEHGETGVLIENHSDQWIRAIERLVDDRARLEKMKSACRERCLGPGRPPRP